MHQNIGEKGQLMSINRAELNTERDAMRKANGR